MSCRGRSRPAHRAPVVAAAIALAVLGSSAAIPAPAPAPIDGRPPNVLLVIADDQPWDTVPATSGPPAMPWLEARLRDPGDRWLHFENAYVNVPLCCPSRASILTGMVARRTRVESNGDGQDFDESSTLATWLDAAGYQTAFIGKYLNGYPWDRGPYVPAGWDRFLAKRNLDVSTTYAGYPFVDQGVPLLAGTGPQAHASGLLAREAEAFLAGASTDQPWFLVFSPTAPHEPWTPAPADAGSFSGEPVPTPSARSLDDVRDKPAWVRSLPTIGPATAEALLEQRRRLSETLRGVDRAVRRLVTSIERRGELGRTIVVYLSDNGYSFGEHRWIGKRCPYEACVRIPFVVRSPWAHTASISTPVSNIDIAPTILDLAGLGGSVELDGRSLRPMLEGADQHRERRPILIEWAGDEDVPAWRGIRTADFSYIEHSDGTVELYDLSGRLGPADPLELHDRAGDPAYRRVRETLATKLREFLSQSRAERAER
jgi:N-acetylglucosamine-6-sulfatase